MKPDRSEQYAGFVRKKSQYINDKGFEPTWIPEWLHDFQKFLVDWSIRKGRSAIFADCGMGKTPMQLVWAQNVVEKTGKNVMIATPIAVGAQTVAEAAKFGIEAMRSRDGKMPATTGIVVTNYEQLHKYDPSRFGGVVCDESSSIKDAKSARKATVVEFLRTVPYRFLCTATAAPNDYWELGTSSEALGLLGFRDMITTFFKQETQKDGLGWGRTKYRFRGHAEDPFWAWVCSWARSLRMPSDLGFDDTNFVLPELIEREIVVQSSMLRSGMLLAIPANGMREEREERRNSLRERCEKAAEISMACEGPCVSWCELNPEADLMEQLLTDVVQVSGSMSDDAKEEALIAFSRGQIKRLVTKPKIGAWGLNWQHCHDTTVFPSHSFEQYYQLVRRFYRFGQKSSVTASIIVSEGEQGITDSLKRKKYQLNRMFEGIVRHMKDCMSLSSTDFFPTKEELPKWLSSSK